MALVKICGITNLSDALACVEAGADMLGFNFYTRSPRYIEPRAARLIVERLPRGVVAVGVFVNEESPERVAELADIAGVEAVQLHGDEPADYCRALSSRSVIKALRVGQNFAPERAAHCGTQAVLLDGFSHAAYGGTGKTFDWDVAVATRAVVPRLFLAGGLDPENVAEAVRVVRPHAVDACSLLERAPGQKDERLVRAFVAAAHGVAEQVRSEGK